MAFDCVFVDFKENNSAKERILNEFPYARVTPFVGSYFNILKSYINEIKTEYFWFVSDLANLQHFDFDYIPEQHEQRQIHVWNGSYQTEGDVMLIPTAEFKKQMDSLKFLRDYRDINYYTDSTVTFDVWPSVPFSFDNLIEQVRKQKSRYVNYYLKDIHNITPSFWEDQKLYIYDSNRFNLLIPRFAVREELYEYTPRFNLNNYSEPIHFDVCYIYNGEPQAEDNLRSLKQHLKHRSNKLHVIEGVKGRKQAYQTAAKTSTTEYFYAVFAKLKVNKDFGFDFVPDTLKSPRHYIFDCYNPVIDYTYGHQAIILYNKKLVLENDGTALDFTLAQKHDHISLLSAETTFYTDPRVCYRTAFREIVKLMYNNKLKPTVENDFILQKWLDPDLLPGASYVRAAGQDARNFVESHSYDFESIFKSYEWDYVDRYFEQRYS
jgi:hypothetical protein